MEQDQRETWKDVWAYWSIFLRISKTHRKFSRICLVLSLKYWVVFWTNWKFSANLEVYHKIDGLGLSLGQNEGLLYSLWWELQTWNNCREWIVTCWSRKNFISSGHQKSYKEQIKKYWKFDRTYRVKYVYFVQNCGSFIL